MACQTHRSRIRAILADNDQARRETVMLSVLSSQMFDLVAVAVSAEQCNRLIEETLPELVVCPEAFVDALTEHPCFPLFVLVGRAELQGTRIVSRIQDGTDGESTHKALAFAASEVLTLKAHDLSTLISHYLQFSDDARSEEVLDVELDGSRHQLPVQEIYWIEAARNNVAIHARSGVFDAREPITRLASRLQKSGFLRVHRRAVVNSAMIATRITDSGVVVGLCLEDGTQIRVGPSFRDKPL